MSDEVLVKVEGVSKKFCRSLKRSLWYGVQDVASELLDRRGRHDALQKNEFRAIDDVSFKLKRGECLGLIGPKGAG
jgi:lipopolysaccharide transport system ATP-binding protein